MDFKKLEKTLKKYGVEKIEKAPVVWNEYPFYTNCNAIFLYLLNGEKRVWYLEDFNLFNLKCYLKNLI